jgi:hypothetical protein
MVLTPEEFEVPVHTPILIPGISTKPVLDSVLNTPSNDLYGMATFCLAVNVLINPGRVTEEVMIDGHGSRNWPIGVDFCHDLKLIGIKDIGIFCEDLVIFIADSIFFIAFLIALWCWVDPS